MRFPHGSLNSFVAQELDQSARLCFRSKTQLQLPNSFLGALTDSKANIGVWSVKKKSTTIRELHHPHTPTTHMKAITPVSITVFATIFSERSNLGIMELGNGIQTGWDVNDEQLETVVKHLLPRPEPLPNRPSNFFIFTLRLVNCRRSSQPSMPWPDPCHTNAPSEDDSYSAEARNLHDPTYPTLALFVRPVIPSYPFHPPARDTAPCGSGQLPGPLGSLEYVLLNALPLKHDTLKPKKLR